MNGFMPVGSSSADVNTDHKRKESAALLCHPLESYLGHLLKTDSKNQVAAANAFNLSTREVEIGGSLCVRGQHGLQDLLPGQLGLLHKATLSLKKKKR